MNRARCFGSNVTGNASGKRKLREQSLHPLRILGDVGIELAVCSFEISVGDEPGSTMPRPSDVDNVQIMLLDETIEVDINEVEARRLAPVTEEPALNVLDLQRLAQQRSGE